MHDALYRHLVHIGDCHRHLLIITVTCTLRSAINTWRYQWRAAAPQRLFRPPQSWWERELAAKTEDRLNATHEELIAAWCAFSQICNQVKRIYLYHSSDQPYLTGFMAALSLPHPLFVITAMIFRSRHRGFTTYMFIRLNHWPSLAQEIHLCWYTVSQW